MFFPINLTDSQLKVFSSIFSDIAAAWIIGAFVTRDPLTLTLNFIGAIVSIYLSIKAEDLRKEL